MSLDITFTLSEQDLEHFKTVLNESKKNLSSTPKEEIIAKAKALSQSIGDNVPEFITSRLAILDTLVAMAEDPQWDLEPEEKEDIMSALAYFADEQDLIADDIPVLGLMDDAIMIELVSLDLNEDIEAYTEYCAYRNNTVNPEASKEDWLEAKRKELYSRMRTRRRSRRRGGSSGFKGIFR